MLTLLFADLKNIAKRATTFFLAGVEMYNYFWDSFQTSWHTIIVLKSHKSGHLLIQLIRIFLATSSLYVGNTEKLGVGISFKPIMSRQNYNCVCVRRDCIRRVNEDTFCYRHVKYIHTTHALSEGVAEASRVFFPNAHVLPKLLSYV
jgi:hypothetical protein